MSEKREPNSPKMRDLPEEVKEFITDVEKALEENPGSVLFEEDEGLHFVVKKPIRAHISRFNKTIMNDPQTASENLLKDTVVFPNKETLNIWLMDNPAAVPELAAEVNKLAGGGKKFRKK